MNSLMRPEEQADVRDMLKRTHRFQSERTVNHTFACGCDFCRQRRETEECLDAFERGDATLLAEKLARRISGIGGGA